MPHCQLPPPISDSCTPPAGLAPNEKFLDEVKAKFPNPAEDKVAVGCQVGGRSAKAAQLLDQVAARGCDRAGLTLLPSQAHPAFVTLRMCKLHRGYMFGTVSLLCPCRSNTRPCAGVTAD